MLVELYKVSASSRAVADLICDWIFIIAWIYHWFYTYKYNIVMSNFEWDQQRKMSQRLVLQYGLETKLRIKCTVLIQKGPIPASYNSCVYNKD